jgi:hypothetical protein
VAALPGGDEDAPTTAAGTCPDSSRRDERRTLNVSAGQLAEEFTLIEAVFEGFAPVDENHRNFVGELAAQLVTALDIHLA